VRGARSSRELFFGFLANPLRHVFEILRAVAAFGCEQRSASEQLCSEVFTRIDFATNFEDSIESVPYTAHRGYAAVKVGCKSACHALLGIIRLGVRRKSAGGTEVNMHVDQPREDGLAGSFYDLSF